MPTAFYIDYAKLEVEAFVQKFRAKFNGEPVHLPLEVMMWPLHFYQEFRIH